MREDEFSRPLSAIWMTLVNCSFIAWKMKRASMSCIVLVWKVIVMLGWKRMNKEYL